MTAVLHAQISGGERRALDFYPTPPLATKAILPHIAQFPGTIWECACGDGAMAKILLENGFAVYAADIVDRGYAFGHSGVDFLAENSARGESIVTNPPFEKSHEFIEHMHKLGVNHIALLLKADFWNAKCRESLWAIRPPSKILGLTWRLDFTGAGRPHRNCIWCIWDPNESGTSYGLLGKPV